MTDRDTYYNMSKWSKWEWFVEGFRHLPYILDCYNDGHKYGYGEFWEGLSMGYYEMYIYPYDDLYNSYLSPERKLRLGRWTFQYS